MSDIASHEENPQLPNGDWIIQRGDQRFTAPDLPTIKQWFTEKRVLPSDSIWHSSLDGWKTPSELFDAPSVNQPSKSMSPAALILLVFGGGFTMLVLTCTSVALWSRGSGTASPRTPSLSSDDRQELESEFVRRYVVAQKQRFSKAGVEAMRNGDMRRGRALALAAAGAGDGRLRHQALEQVGKLSDSRLREMIADSALWERLADEPLPDD